MGPLYPLPNPARPPLCLTSGPHSTEREDTCNVHVLTALGILGYRGHNPSPPHVPSVHKVVHGSQSTARSIEHPALAKRGGKSVRKRFHKTRPFPDRYILLILSPSSKKT